MTQIAIVAAKRTAVGSFGGGLASVSADALGATVIRQLLADTQVSGEDISEVIMGQVLTAGQGQNPARKATIDAGLPNTCPAMTINKVCGSGLKAVALGVQSILLGDAEIVIAGGQENMSQSGHVLLGSRDGFRMGNASLVDTMLKDG
jgi:Acetyl-CoA acetyltransferase